MTTRKSKRPRRDSSARKEERYALILIETSPRYEGYQNTLLRNLTPEQAAYWVRKFKR